MKIVNFTQNGLFKFCSYDLKYINFYPTRADHVGAYEIIIVLRDRNPAPK